MIDIDRPRRSGFAGPLILFWLWIVTMFALYLRTFDSTISLLFDAFARLL